MIHEHPPHKESYKHMQGTPKRAHEGSQSNHPNPAFGGNAVLGGGGGTMPNDHDGDE